MATWDGNDYQGDNAAHQDEYFHQENVKKNNKNVYNNNSLSSNEGTSSSSWNYYSQPQLKNNNYFENNRHEESNNFYHENYNNINSSTKNSIKNIKNVIKKSNLDAEANEFVPSDIKIPNEDLDSSKIFFANNKNKYKNNSNNNNNRKFDNKRNNNNRGNNYTTDKRNHQTSNNYYQHQNHNRHFNNDTQEYFNENTKSNSRDGYKNRTRYHNYPSQYTTNYSNQYTGHNESNDNDKQNKNRPRMKENYSEDPRDEKFRGNRVDANEVDGNEKFGRWDRQRLKSRDYSEESRDEKYQFRRHRSNENDMEDDKFGRWGRQRVKNKDYNDTSREEKYPYRRNRLNEGEDEDKFGRWNRQRPKEEFSEDPRDEKYRGKRGWQEDKFYREKRTNYQEYNDKFTSSEDKHIKWRQKNPGNPVKKSVKKFELDDAASQKERLTEQLNRGQLECLVCCDYIRQNDPTWCCTNCYHVLHLKCIKKWAESSQSDTGWRCPACQNVNVSIPDEYYCFCGKTKDPEWNRRDVAHSCGEICGRDRIKNNCLHKCTLLCHPGSCPLCISMVTRFCGCGKTSQSLKCSTDTLLSCQDTCNKLLNCQNHQCQKKCHHGDCDPCSEIINQKCFCGKHSREVPCLPDTPEVYECGNVCDKLLECENHRCKELCHPGDCHVCPLKPEIVSHCWCGQTPLTEKRKSCLSPIPTCDKVCSKRLKCGQPSDPHTCKAICHENDCPPCELTTWVKCRCGNMDRELACIDLTTKADDARCEKKCIKKRSCGKHKCNQLCCIDIEHICPLPCSKNLSCGKHKCELTCHKGRCQPCYRSSFEELYCECGAAVIYPPVPCGTRKPTCSRPCSRPHSCGHEVLHNCHSETNCPPCTVLTQKWCYGKHELRKAVACYFNEISCGKPCGKPLTCGRHKCITLCHPGSCKKTGQICTQPCTTTRELCEHICGAPCHDGKCPDTPCKEMVKVTCTCGHRSMTRACAENAREYHRIASSILASKMADMQLGHTVNLEEVFGQGAKKQNQLKTLECNDECKMIERNRKLALGLQIVNPDLSGKLMPRYSDFMKQWARKDPNFCQMVHDKLTELVQLAKTSKQKSRSYSFDCMNTDKRKFVHESCEHFGCESQAYDNEPKRNVVATAVKDKCWLPSYSLLEIVQRENGLRKVPRPMLNSLKTNTSTSASTSGDREVLKSTAKKNQRLKCSDKYAIIL